MELCALALMIIEGGTGLRSTLGWRHGKGREAPRGVVARPVPEISVGRGFKFPIRQESPVPLTLAMAGG